MEIIPSKLSDLNPKLIGSQLIINCPVCKNIFSIDINYQSNSSTNPNRWSLTHPENIFDWDSVTIYPSIMNHPQARDKNTCNAHFSIVNGNILF
jgi:hypothetical protein